MHEEATSMSVPSSVAASTTQNENGTTPTVSVVTAEVELNVTVDNDNVDLQVPFSSNSGGNLMHPQYCHYVIHRLLFLVVSLVTTVYAFMCTTNLFPYYIQIIIQERKSLSALTQIHFYYNINSLFSQQCTKVNLKGK